MSEMSYDDETMQQWSRSNDNTNDNNDNNRPMVVIGLVQWLKVWISKSACKVDEVSVIKEFSFID